MVIGAIGQGATIAITIRAIDKFSNTFRKANTGMGILKASFKAGAIAVASVGVAMVGLGVAVTKVAGDFEQTQVAFTTMLGSAEEADKFLKELADFAKKTPFELKGVELAARQLMAVGFEADDVLPVLTDVGNIAAGLGLGQEGLQRLILNLGQVQAQGKLTGRELRDFAVAGIPLLDELAKELGITTEEVQALVSAGKIETETVLKVFNNMASAGGRFADLMEKQAKTVQGRFSNLKDTLTILGREIGQMLLPIVGQLADTFLNDIIPAIQPLIPLIGEFLVGALKAIVPILPKLTELLSRFINFSIGLFEALGPLIEPLTEIAFTILTALLDVLEPLIPQLKELVPPLADILKALVPILVPLTKLIALLLELGLGVILPVLTPALKILAIALTKIGEVFGFIIDKVVFLIGLLKDLILLLAKITFGAINKAVDFVKGTIGGGRNSKKVGDAIIRPNGQIIETDPRDTLIATRNPGGLDGGITLIVQGDLIGLDAEDISRRLNDELNNKLSL